MKSDKPLAVVQLRDKVVLFLSSLASWGSESVIRNRMEAESRHVTTGAEYSYRLSDEFAQSLIWFPIAIDYLCDLPIRQNNWSNDVEWTSRGLSFFMSSWHSNLRSSNLIGPAVSSIESVLQLWNASFAADSSVIDWTRVVEFPPAAVLLESFLEFDIPFDGTSLCDMLLGRWLRNSDGEAACANALVFMRFVRESPENWLICRHPDALDAAFDAALCRRHWERAKTVLTLKCPRFYAREIEHMTT